MNTEERLLEINDYYHDELEKALNILYRLQDAELKHKLHLPKGIQDDIYAFTENFKFKYHDR